MKWLYLPYPRNTITQSFDKNANPLYKEGGLKGHTAIDWNTACGTPLYNCAEGYCYAVRNKDAANLAQYRSIYLIVENSDGVFEVSYGHLTDIYAEAGKTYKVGDLIGTTGNTGDVYSGGVKVTKYRPGCPGGHLHGPQVRVLKKVKTRVSTKKYLTTANGIYKKDGYYFEIPNYNNGYNGCADPELYMNDILAKDYKATPMLLELNAEGEHVKRLQEALNTLGWWPKNQKITGFYGPITEKAHNDFTADSGLRFSTTPTSTGSEDVVGFSGMNKSGLWQLKARDFILGLVVAAGTAAFAAIADALEFGVFADMDWKSIASIAATAALGYVTKNLASDEEGRVLGEV